MMEDATSIPGIEAENPEGPANSCFSDPLQHSQSALSSLRLKWLLGGLQLGIELSPIKH